MESNIHIREAHCADSARLAEMNLDFNEVKVSPDSMREKIEDDARTEIVLVAEDAGLIVGFAAAQLQSSICYEVPWAELKELFVEGSHRRRGIRRRRCLRRTCKEEST